MGAKLPEGHTQHRVACGGLPPWEGLGGRGQRACRQDCPDGQNGPLACSRIRVSHGLRSPRPPRVLGALDSGGPGWRTQEGGDRGQQVLCRQPGLGLTSTAGCLSDPGQVTLTRPGLSFHNHRMETAPTPQAGLLCHSQQVTAPRVADVHTYPEATPSQHHLGLFLPLAPTGPPPCLVSLFPETTSLPYPCQAQAEHTVGAQ